MFGEKLQSAVQSISGGHAAILMGLDGIPIDSFVDDETTDIETIGMEFSVVLKEIRKAAEQLEVGFANEVTVRAAKLTTIIRIINDEYFVALLLSPTGNLGKARYLLRVIAPEFKAEL